jgi:hypothetical protein
MFNGRFAVKTSDRSIVWWEDDRADDFYIGCRVMLRTTFKDEPNEDGTYDIIDTHIWRKPG